MNEQAPDADATGEWQVLNIRPVCTELRRRMGLQAADAQITPDRVLACLRSMSDSFGSSAQKRSLLRARGREAISIVLHRAWGWIRGVCQRRRSVAQVVLRRLLDALPAGVKGADLIVECKARDLLDAIAADLELCHTIKEPAAALEHALLYLHDNEILGAAPGTPLGQIAVLARTHDSLQPLRALCDDTGMLFELVSSEAARSRVSFMRLREGWQTMQQLPGQRATLVDLPALQRWLAARVDEEAYNPHWADIAAAVDECAGAAQVEHTFPPRKSSPTNHSNERREACHGCIRGSALRCSTRKSSTVLTRAGRRSTLPRYTAWMGATSRGLYFSSTATSRPASRSACTA